MKLIKDMCLVALMVMPVIGLAEGEEAGVKWDKSFAAGVTYKGGNTEKTLVTSNLKGDRYSKDSDWINSLYGEYGKTEGEITEGQLLGKSDYRYKFGDEKNMFGGVFGEILYDDIKKIRTQAKAGPNVGYYFVNTDKVKLDASFGVNYVYRRTVAEEDNFGEYRVAANYKNKLSETADYYLSLEYAANAEDTDDGNGLLVTGLKNKVNSQISTFIELRLEYDNIPTILDEATGDRADYTDATIIAGLTYDF
ncbi:MAG TPA: DUF481 domain-containing protein [Pontiella sp.]